jgi:hypothetical protein
MAEAHLPKLDDENGEGAPAEPAAVPFPPRRRKPVTTLLLEVALISAGVFLGLMGEQWRENAANRELAEASLRRFRTEIANNRKAVAAVKDYHTRLKQQLDSYFESKGRTSVQLTQSLAPVFFERAEWDLALATEALAYIKPELASAISRAYTTQQGYADIENAMIPIMYSRSYEKDGDVFLRSLHAYFGDVAFFDPTILRAYDDVLLLIDQELGEGQVPRATTK